LKAEQGKPPVVVNRLAHAADSIEEVKAYMRAMVDTADWPEEANGFRIIGEDDEELFRWP
jgi:hypothetical protein